MAITALTLPNGVRIETTADLAEIGNLLGSALPTNMATEQPKAAETAQPQPTPEPKARPKATKRTTEPKARQARQPKAAQTNGKALWASITAAVAEGNYDEARRLASVKPDTFGVQAEAAIDRAKARQAKQPKAGKPSSLPRKGEIVESVVVLSDATKAKLAKANAAEAQAPKEPEAPATTPKASRKRNHKADCGCPTCPKGIAARQAKQAPKEQQAQEPKAPKAAPQPKAAQEPKAPTEAIKVRDDAAEQRECDRIVAKGNEQAQAMLSSLDTEGLKEAIRNYNTLAKRNLRLGNEALAIAYDECLDTCSLALTMAKEAMALK